MKTSAIQTVSLILLASIAIADEPMAADLKALQGTWRGWVVEGKGQQPDQGIVHLEVVVKDTTIIAQRLDRTKDAALGEGTFNLLILKRQPPGADAKSGK